MIGWNEDRSGIDSSVASALNGRALVRTSSVERAGMRLRQITFDLGPQRRRATTGRTYLVKLRCPADRQPE
jgi:hypothetical protein